MCVTEEALAGLGPRIAMLRNHLLCLWSTGRFTGLGLRAWATYQTRKDDNKRRALTLGGLSIFKKLNMKTWAKSTLWIGGLSPS